MNHFLSPVDGRDVDQINLKANTLVVGDAGEDASIQTEEHSIDILDSTHRINIESTHSTDELFQVAFDPDWGGWMGFKGPGYYPSQLYVDVLAPWDSGKAMKIAGWSDIEDTDNIDDLIGTDTIVIDGPPAFPSVRGNYFVGQEVVITSSDNNDGTYIITYIEFLDTNPDPEASLFELRLTMTTLAGADPGFVGGGDLGILGNVGVGAYIGNYNDLSADSNAKVVSFGFGDIIWDGAWTEVMNLDFSGNMTLTGDINGRDIAADGSSLDSAEAVNGIMKSDGAGSFSAAVEDTDYQGVLAEGAFADGDKTKLDNIEALADVTDATNVDAAGAVMNTDTTTASMSFVVDEDDMSSNSDTKVPTQQSVKAYADGLPSPIAHPVILLPQGATLPDTNPALLSRTDGTNFPYQTLDFDDSTSESATWVFEVPKGVDTTDVSFTISWKTAATSGNCKWDLAFESMADGAQFDQALGGSATVTDVAAGTTEYISTVDIATADHSTDLTAGEVMVLTLSRDVAVGSDITGDCKLVNLIVRFGVS